MLREHDKSTNKNGLLPTAGSKGGVSPSRLARRIFQKDPCIRSVSKVLSTLKTMKEAGIVSKNQGQGKWKFKVTLGVVEKLVQQLKSKPEEEEDTPEKEGVPEEDEDEEDASEEVEDAPEEDEDEDEEDENEDEDEL